MSGRMNWEKLERERRLNYTPSPRVRPATQRQIDYILGLAHQKGQPRPRLPKTMHGAGELIDRLKALPDVNTSVFYQDEAPTGPDPVVTSRQALVAELRDQFPQLTPMTANSMVQLFEQIDETGLAFVLDSLYQEDTPEDANVLILYILKRFLAEFGDLIEDDEALVHG